MMPDFPAVSRMFSMPVWGEKSKEAVEEVTPETLRRDIDLKVSRLFLVVFVMASLSFMCCTRCGGADTTTAEMLLIGRGISSCRPLTSLR